MVRSGKKGGSSSQSPTRVALQSVGDVPAGGEFLTALASVQNLQSTLQKKIRNIEKRKRTVQENIEKLARGEELNKEQKESITRLAEVEGNQVFAMDLQKMVNTTLSEVETADVRSRASVEATRTSSQRDAATAVVRTFVTLGAIAKSAQLREDHTAGKYGTDCQLTVPQFEQLVELNKLLLSTLTATDSSKNSIDAATARLVRLIETPPAPTSSPSIVQPQPTETAPTATETKEVKDKAEGKKKEKGKKAGSAEKVSEKPAERRGSLVVTLGGQEVAYADLRESLTKLAGSHYFAPLFGLQPTSDPVKPPEKPKATASNSNVNAGASAANTVPTASAGAPQHSTRESRAASRTTSKCESEVTVGTWTPTAPVDTHTNGDSDVNAPVDPLASASRAQIGMEFTFQQQSRASLYAKEFVPAAAPAKQPPVVPVAATPYPLGVGTELGTGMNWPNPSDATIPQQQAFLPAMQKQQPQPPVGSGADIAPTWQPNSMTPFNATLSSDPAVVPTAFDPNRPPTSQFAPAFAAAPVMAAWNDDPSALSAPLNLSAGIPVQQTQPGEFVGSVGVDQQAVPQQVPGGFGEPTQQQQQQYQQQPFNRGRGRGGPGGPRGGQGRRFETGAGQRGGPGGFGGGGYRGAPGGGRAPFRGGRGGGGPPRGDFDQHDGPPPQQQPQQPQGVWGGLNTNSGGNNFRGRGRGGPQRTPVVTGVQQRESATGFTPAGPPPPAAPDAPRFEAPWD